MSIKSGEFASLHTLAPVGASVWESARDKAVALILAKGQIVDRVDDAKQAIFFETHDPGLFPDLRAQSSLRLRRYTDRGDYNRAARGPQFPGSGSRDHRPVI